MYTIIVEFRIAEGQMDAFLPLMKANAAASVEQEPGCHQFDVVQLDGAPDVIFLYEVYEDRAAFDAHLASEHFAAFEAASAGMIADKSVRTGTRV